MKNETMNFIFKHLLQQTLINKFIIMKIVVNILFLCYVQAWYLRKNHQ